MKRKVRTKLTETKQRQTHTDRNKKTNTKT
jgi:hypothetical protein